MGMNKAEKAEMERLRTRLAFRLTEPVEPDIPIPTEYGKATVGWRAFAWRDGYRVEECESSTILHRVLSHVGEGHEAWSQQGIRLHSSKLRALRAARYEMEQIFTRVLREIDVKIEQESAK